MEKINQNKILYFFVHFVTCAIAAMIIWPLLDMLFDQKDFVYSVNSHIISPIIFGAIMAVFLTIYKIITDKKSKS